MLIFFPFFERSVYLHSIAARPFQTFLIFASFLFLPTNDFLFSIISFTAFDMLQSKVETAEERRLRMPRRRTTAAVKV